MTFEFPTTPSSSFLRSHCFRRRGPVTRRGRRAWAPTSAWTTRGGGTVEFPRIRGRRGRRGGAGEGGPLRPGARSPDPHSAGATLRGRGTAKRPQGPGDTGTSPQDGTRTTACSCCSAKLGPPPPASRRPPARQGPGSSAQPCWDHRAPRTAALKPLMLTTGGSPGGTAWGSCSWTRCQDLRGQDSRGCR